MLLRHSHGLLQRTSRLFGRHRSSSLGLLSTATPSSAEREAHLRIKEQLDAGSMVRVRVRVDPELRTVLRLPKKKKSGRVFMAPSDARNLESLRAELEGHLGLPRDAFQLHHAASDAPHIPLDSDDAVQHAWDAQEDGSLSLLVARNPAVEWPPPGPAYLSGMADPSAAEAMQMLSFYQFRAIADPEELADRLAAAWGPTGTLGRVYVSSEGVNAQVAVPTNVMGHFKQACESQQELRGVELNLDAAVSMGEFLACPPFRALHVRPREQIVSDGIDPAQPLELDAENCGEPLEPDAWHAALDNPGAVILDCRNSYESDVGAFKGAVPLGTTVFRDTWDALGRVLDGKPKDTPLLTYCTGGIRCVKVGAYLTQKLGYTNVGRLEGGIVNYTQHIRRVAETEDVPFANVSKFSGLNYVFNDRMAEFVTPDIPNPASADRRAVEAKAVVANRLRRFGSPANGAAGEKEQRRGFHSSAAAGSTEHGSDELEEYSGRQSGQEPDLLAEVRLTTEAMMPNAGHMVSGHLQGRLLVMLGNLVGARRVLEIGTFTGYSALCFAEAGAHVTTLEVDPKAASVARGFFERSDYPERLELREGAALETLGKMVREDGAGPFDVVFIDADKRKYGEYLDMLLDSGTLTRPGTLILADNVLWKGRVLGLCTAGPAAEGAAAPAGNSAEERAARRDRVLTQAMHEFNVKVRKERRVEQVVLPLRDGLSLIRVL